MTRLVARNVYKYPVLIGVPDQIKRRQWNILGESKYKENAIKLISGTTVSLMESLITCPIERLKVFVMTQKEQDGKSIRNFFSFARSQ